MNFFPPQEFCARCPHIFFRLSLCYSIIFSFITHENLNNSFSHLLPYVSLQINIPTTSFYYRGLVHYILKIINIFKFSKLFIRHRFSRAIIFHFQTHEFTMHNTQSTFFVDPSLNAIPYSFITYMPRKLRKFLYP